MTMGIDEWLTEQAKELVASAKELVEFRAAASAAVLEALTLHASGKLWYVRLCRQGPPCVRGHGVGDSISEAMKEAESDIVSGMRGIVTAMGKETPDAPTP